MGELKSAYELAMERLRAKDAEAGEAERPLSDEQKERIAEIRRETRAKLAERDIMLQSKLQRLAERTRPEELPAARQKLEEEHAAERRRLEEEEQGAIRAVRDSK